MLPPEFSGRPRMAEITQKQGKNPPKRVGEVLIDAEGSADPQRSGKIADLKQEGGRKALDLTSAESGTGRG